METKCNNYCGTSLLLTNSMEFKKLITAQPFKQLYAVYGIGVPYIRKTK
jgi:hypothetical protein